jgi:hypothetical protein
MWIPFHVGIQGNKQADVLANESSISGNLFQDQAELTTETHLTFTLAHGLDCCQNGRKNEITTRWTVTASQWY